MGLIQLLAPLYRLSAKEKNRIDAKVMMMLMRTMMPNISIEAELKSMEDGTDAINERGKIVMKMRLIIEL